MRMKESRLKNIIGKLTEAYVVFFVVAFPLFVHDKYFDILNDKFYLFWMSCAILAGVSIVAAIIMLPGELGGQRRTGKAAAKGAKGRKGADGDDQKRTAPGFGMRLKAFFQRLSLPDRFFLLFMIVSIVSTVCSEYPYEAFWGHYGRYQGLFLWFFYAALYVLISRFYRARQWHMDLFLVVGAAMSIWACLDYLGFDILGWRGAIGDPMFRYDFSSGIGNVNSLTAMISLYMSVSAVLFTDQAMGDLRGKCRKALYGISFFLSATALIMSASDNGALAAAALLYVLPFYCWKKRSGINIYLLTAALFFLSMYATGMATEAVNALNSENAAAGGSFGLDIMPQHKWGILLMLSNGQKDLMGQIFVVILFITMFKYFLDYSGWQKKRKEVLGDYGFEAYMEEPAGRSGRILWGAVGVAAIVGIAWMFYDANTGGHPELYQPYSKFFIFNDYWGTNRGFNWKILIGYFAGFPLIRKLIGAGPETYGVYTGVRDYYHMIETTNETYDSPHNEFLQYLFSTGIISFIGYYGTVATAVWGGIFGKGNAVRPGQAGQTEQSVSRRNRPRATTISAAAAFAVLSYTAASLVNISAPTVTPMMILLLSICVGESCRQDEE